MLKSVKASSVFKNKIHYRLNSANLVLILFGHLQLNKIYCIEVQLAETSLGLGVLPEKLQDLSSIAILNLTATLEATS